MTETGTRAPAFWRSAKWNGANQPVVGVSFWEAEAFAAWAGGRLPTADESEAAARGREGYEYPWGDEWEDGMCNSSEVGLDMTSPVGLFPRGQSPFGLEDMAGNVWEWSQSIGAQRVIRGGSWLNTPGDVRSALRFRLGPESRNYDLGFRLALDVD